MQQSSINERLEHKVSYNPLWHLAWKMTPVLHICLRDDRVNLKDKTEEHQRTKGDSPHIYAVLPLERGSPPALFNNQHQIRALFSQHEQMQWVRDTDLQTFAKVLGVEYLRGMSFWGRRKKKKEIAIIQMLSWQHTAKTILTKHDVLSLWTRYIKQVAGMLKFKQFFCQE